MIKLIGGGLLAVLALASVWLWLVRPGIAPQEGQAAPDFAMSDAHGQTHRLADYAGRWLVLYFYPRDDTPGCTREACHFRDDIATLGTLDAEVVGVSVDPPESHRAFAEKFALPFPLLSDPRGRVAAAYGSLLNLGLWRFARRHTFIIAPDGRIARRFDQVQPAHHARDVLAALRRLQGRIPDTAAVHQPD